MLRVPKILKKFIISPLWWSSIDIFVVALQKPFVLWLEPESIDFSTELT